MAEIDNVGTIPVRTNQQLRSDIDKGVSELQGAKDSWAAALQRQERERNAQNGMATYGQMKELAGRQELAELQNGQRAQDAIASALAIASAPENKGRLPRVVTDYLNRQFGFDGENEGIIDGGIDPKTGEFGFVFGERDGAGNVVPRKQMIPLSVQLGLMEGYPSLFSDDAVKAHRQRMLDSGLSSGEVDAYSNVARLARERLAKRMSDLSPRDTRMEIEQLKEEGRNRRAEGRNETRLAIANLQNDTKIAKMKDDFQIRMRNANTAEERAKVDKEYKAALAEHLVNSDEMGWARLDETSAHNQAQEAQAALNEEGRNRRAEGKTAGGKPVDPQKSVAAMKGMLELARSSGMSSDDLAQLEAWTQSRIKGMTQGGGETSGDGGAGRKVSYNDLKPGQTFVATGKDGQKHRFRKTETGHERID